MKSEDGKTRDGSRFFLGKLLAPQNPLAVTNATPVDSLSPDGASATAADAAREKSISLAVDASAGGGAGSAAATAAPASAAIKGPGVEASTPADGDAAHSLAGEVLLPQLDTQLWLRATAATFRAGEHAHCHTSTQRCIQLRQDTAQTLGTLGRWGWQARALSLQVCFAAYLQ